MNLHLCFRYNPRTGNIVWRRRPLEHFPDTRAWKVWNTRYAGRIAGRKPLSKHYRDRAGMRVGICNIAHCVHAVIWQMVKGPIPSGLVVDHINGNPWDNRWSNLRLVTPAQNSANTKRPSTNTSGYKGVSWSRRGRCWLATYRVNRRTKHIYGFSNKKHAHAAYKKAVIELRGEYARTN